MKRKGKEEKGEDGRKEFGTGMSSQRDSDALRNSAYILYMCTPIKTRVHTVYAIIVSGRRGRHVLAVNRSNAAGTLQVYSL